MKILCVEDGSVDIEALENGELRDGKVLIYRQGSKPPFMLDIPDSCSEMYQNFKKVWKELQEFMEKSRYQSCYIEDALKIMYKLEETWMFNPPTRR